MKTLILLTFFIMSASVIKAQSLKEALYGGRLKADTGLTVKKGDSLKLRENIAQKLKDDSLKKVAITEAAMTADSTKAMMDSSAVAVDPTTIAPESNAPTAPASNPTKDNNAVWKKFVEEYTPIINAEVLTSKKIKNGTYYVLIEYEIGVDGTITTVNITSTPSNSFLEDQVKQRMMANAPQLTPVLMTNGKPRKMYKKQMLTFVKEKN